MTFFARSPTKKKSLSQAPKAPRTKKNRRLCNKYTVFKFAIFFLRKEMKPSFEIFPVSAKPLNTLTISESQRGLAGGARWIRTRYWSGDTSSNKHKCHGIVRTRIDVLTGRSTAAKKSNAHAVTVKNITITVLTFHFDVRGDVGSLVFLRREPNLTPRFGSQHRDSFPADTDKVAERSVVNLEDRIWMVGALMQICKTKSPWRRKEQPSDIRRTVEWYKLFTSTNTEHDLT